MGWWGGWGQMDNPMHMFSRRIFLALCVVGRGDAEL